MKAKMVQIEHVGVKCYGGVVALNYKLKEEMFLKNQQEQLKQGAQ